MASSPKSRKAKGREGQQAIRDKLLETFEELEPGDVISTSMGDSGSDLKLSPAALKLIPISPEVKRRKSGLKTIYGWFNQAKSGGSYWPTLFMRQDRCEWLVVINLENYLDLLKNYKRK